MGRPPARCGTPSGYNAHNVRGEKACDACRAAMREYKRRPDQVARRKAHAKALRRLSWRYPEEFQTFYIEELARLLAEVSSPEQPQDGP